jgi:hypothetical protein
LKLVADEDLLQRKVHLLIAPPSGVEYRFAKPAAYIQAVVARLPNDDSKAVSRAVNKRLQQLRYIRTVMRAALYVQNYPIEPKEGDEKRARGVFERKKWNEEMAAETTNAKKDKEKRGDFKKTVEQIAILRSGNAVRCCGGELASTSGISYRYPSRFAYDRDIQSELFVLWKSQVWAGVCDTSRSQFSRGKDNH